MNVIDEYGVEFRAVFEKEGAVYGYDVDGNCLEICASFTEVTE